MQLLPEFVECDGRGHKEWRRRAIGGGVLAAGAQTQL